MIQALHHIAVIGYSGDTIEFYEALGFQIDNRRVRPEYGDELEIGNAINAVVRI